MVNTADCFTNIRDAKTVYVNVDKNKQVLTATKAGDITVTMGSGQYLKITDVLIIKDLRNKFTISAQNSQSRF